MYPETPGRADLVLASPMFTSVAVHTSGGQTLSISAPGASDTNRYVQSLQVRGAIATPHCADGANYACPWLPASAVTTTGAQLTYTLGDQPNQQWGTAASAAPWSMSTR
jgi:putative alpha-1,2-mannosidase